MLTPISFAIMPARVVLPSPGGPYRRTWSRGSPRIFAASIKTLRFSFAFVCPIYSERILGLSVYSISVSALVSPVETMRSSLLSVIAICFTRFFIHHVGLCVCYVSITVQYTKVGFLIHILSFLRQTLLLLSVLCGLLQESTQEPPKPIRPRYRQPFRERIFLQPAYRICLHL